jgi:hypothetical protein
MVLTQSRRLAVAHAPFRILDLSPELVEQIFDQLGELKRSTLFAVRYVCRAFKDLSLVAFGTQFFGCLVAILHPISLATLLEIASHPSLSRFMRQIVIGGERIGGLIDVSGQGNEPMLKDLQTSMENSGMDRLVLTVVFGRLSNLQVVRIDTESFHRQIHQIKAIRCGSNCIIERAWKPTDDMDHMRTNRAFDVTLQCLKQAGSAQKINLQMEVVVRPGRSHYVDFFDPTSADWYDSFAANVNCLDLCVQENNPWPFDLLRSARNLQHLKMVSCDGAEHFSHPASGPIAWPRLCHLSIIDLESPCCAMASFFAAHRETLTNVEIHQVEVLSGSWKLPLEIIRSMPKLDYLSLCNLLTMETPYSTPNSFDLLYDMRELTHYFLDLEDRLKINDGVGAILFDFRIVVHTSGRNRVDMRLARAVMEGKAKLREGGYTLLKWVRTAASDGSISK